MDALATGAHTGPEARLLSRVSSRAAVLSITLALAGCGSSPATEPEPPANTGSAPASGAPAPATSTSLPAPSAAAPPPGTVLAHVNGPGRLNVIANVQGRGFDVVSSVLQGGNDMSTLQAHDVDGTPMGKLSPGSFTGECGAADVITHGRRLIITLLIKTVPAAGITQATHSLEMNAWDATSGAQVWSATPVEPSPESLSCQAYDGNLQGVSTTLDGSWGVMLWPPQRFAIDLRNGQLYPRDDLLGTIGNYVTVGTDHTVYDGKPNTVNMTIPGEWKILGTFKAGNSELGTLDLARTGSMASTGSSYTGSSGSVRCRRPTVRPSLASWEIHPRECRTRSRHTGSHPLSRYGPSRLRSTSPTPSMRSTRQSS